MKYNIKGLSISKKEDNLLLSINAEDSIPLSTIIPWIESFGFFVLSSENNSGGEIKFEVSSQDISNNKSIKIKDIEGNINEIFTYISSGKILADKIISLSVLESLNLRKIMLIQAFCSYLVQISSHNLEIIKQTAVKNHNFVKMLLEIFYEKFSESKLVDNSKIKNIEEKCKNHLDKISSIVEDSILNKLLNIVNSITRTNYFLNKDYISFKIDSSKIRELPKPIPFAEIFVYSRDFEAVHLRGGRISRGGIRWSDREDYRIEVLGLMKAQMTKNSVIVPDGSKGGFKLNLTISSFASPKEYNEFGVSCYKNFLRGMLDITDNIIEGKIINPKNIVIYDDNDPYLVVAADKGTATFSDYANQISFEYDFWLSDAFASGGKNGYDHKKIGITSRGAFISAIRHLSEININPYKDIFTCVGIGDMAGDVFGNGLLLTDKYKLLAAFNHAHIFIDPNPDNIKSFKERTRLFNLSGSSWKDYDESIISSGGAVFSRSAKSIELTKEIKKLFKIDTDELTPNEIIKLILKLDVDLMWNGGIGTYIKSSIESNQDVNDKSNDNVRCNGDEIRAKSIIEGGNLGVSQLGRIEYCKNGGLINTDFIDNSAGVDCSDHEVNIKIALNSALKLGKITKEKRDETLFKMTEEVRDLVLLDNYDQTLALSIFSLSKMFSMEMFSDFLDYLENHNVIDRKMEFLPSKKEIQKRKQQNFKLTKPELSVILSYSKRYIYSRIIESKLIQDEFCVKYLFSYFPKLIQDEFKSEILHHSLKNEIIATVLTNKIANVFSGQLIFAVKNETGTKVCDIVRAYIISEEIFETKSIWQSIDNLGTQIKSEVRIELFTEVIRLIKRSICWVLSNLDHPVNIEESINKYKEKAKFLSDNLNKLPKKEIIDSKINFYKENGVDSEIAKKIADISTYVSMLDIIKICSDLNFNDYIKAAELYFEIGDLLNLELIREISNKFINDSYLQNLSVQSIKNDLYSKQKLILAYLIKNKTNIFDLVSSKKELFEKYLEFTSNLRENSKKSVIDDEFNINILILTNNKLDIVLKKSIT